MFQQECVSIDILPTIFSPFFHVALACFFHAVRLGHVNQLRSSDVSPAVLGRICDLGLNVTRSLVSGQLLHTLLELSDGRARQNCHPPGPL
jgi:hypothetical protein